LTFDVLRRETKTNLSGGHEEPASDALQLNLWPQHR